MTKYTLDIYNVIQSIIGGVMDSVLVSSAMDRGFNTDLVKPKTIQLVFAASKISTQK